MSPAIKTADGTFEVQVNTATYRLVRILCVGTSYRVTADDPAAGEVVAWMVFSGRCEGGYHITTIDGELDAFSAPEALHEALGNLAD